MAASIIALAVALLLGASSGVDKGATTPAAEEGLEVTYGSTVELMHDKTKHRLHSHDVPYGSGSGQQSVTGFPEVDDSNSYWIVRPTPDSSAKQGDAIETGSIIRLQHMRTRRWLHSHLHASPLSGNLEVVDHGVDAVLVADMTRLAREFFALPPEEKLQFDMSSGKKGGFIVSSHLQKADAGEEKFPYEGPEFTELPVNVQKGLFKFVEQRGITLPTTNFMHDYMVTKQTEEYVRWLTKLKDFVRQ